MEKTEVTLFDLTILTIEARCPDDPNRPKKRIGGDIYEDDYEALRRLSDLHGFGGDVITYLREEGLKRLMETEEVRLKDGRRR